MYPTKKKCAIEQAMQHLEENKFEKCLVFNCSIRKYLNTKYNYISNTECVELIVKMSLAIIPSKNANGFMLNVL